MIFFDTRFAGTMITSRGDIKKSADSAFNVYNIVFDAALGGVSSGVKGIKKPGLANGKPSHGVEGTSGAKVFDINVAQQKLNNIRSKMPNQNLKTRGNMPIADVKVEGLPEEFIAHSKIHNAGSKGAEIDNFSFTSEKKFFESYVEDGFPRYNDTEAKILEDIASKIKDPNMSGTIDLFTELPAC